MPRVTPVSLLLLCLSVGLAAGALVPQIALAPLAGYLSQSRTPEATYQAARATFAATALACTALAAAHGPVRRSVVAFIGWIAALPCRRYWTMVLGVGALLRLAVCFALPYRPVPDAWWYHETATSLALGLGFRFEGQPGASGGFDLRGKAPLSPRGAADELSVDRQLRRRAEAFLERHPEQAALLALHLYALETSAVTEHFQGDPSGPAGLKYALEAVAQLAYLLIGSLFLARLSDLVRPGRRPCGAQWTAWILIGYFTAMSRVFFGQDRLPLPILPWMLLEGSVALLGLVGLSPSDPLPAPDAEGTVVDELAG